MHEGWRRGGESNPRVKVLQTSALPLGYRAGKDSFIRTILGMEARTGFEPVMEVLQTSALPTWLPRPVETSFPPRAVGSQSRFPGEAARIRTVK